MRKSQEGDRGALGRGLADGAGGARQREAGLPAPRARAGCGCQAQQGCVIGDEGLQPRGEGHFFLLGTRHPGDSRGPEPRSGGSRGVNHTPSSLLSLSAPPHPPRYEEEISRRTDMEFTFVQLKKVARPPAPGAPSSGPSALPPSLRLPGKADRPEELPSPHASPGNRPPRRWAPLSCRGTPPAPALSRLPPPGPGCRVPSSDRAGDQAQRLAELRGADEKHLRAGEKTGPVSPEPRADLSPGKGGVRRGMEPSTVPHLFWPRMEQS